MTSLPLAVLLLCSARAAVVRPPAPAPAPLPGTPVPAFAPAWAGLAKVDAPAVAAAAVQALALADARGRVTPALQAALLRVEAEHAERFSAAARREWQTLVARLGARTSLPISIPEDDTPYWQKDGHPLAGHGAADALPGEADVVVVGAGLTGASAAHRLAEESRARGLRVVVLEAGDPVTQASGRNGGNFHLLPENYRGAYRGLARERAAFARAVDRSLSAAEARALGERQARAILRLSRVNRDRLVGLVAREGIDADLAPNGGVRVARDAAEEAALREEAAFVGGGLEPLTAREIDAALGLPEGTSPHGGRFSSLDGNYHPFKYAVGLLKAAMARGARLFTRTPVLAVEALEEGGHLVRTARGAIRAKAVVFAANAFTSRVLPELEAIRPFRSQIQVTEHVAETWGGRTVTADMGDLYGHHPNGARYRDAEGVSRAPLLLGGGLDAPTADPWRVPRSAVTHRLLLSKRDALHPELAGVPPSREWGGPTAFTPDRLPAIGVLRPGLIVAAGFNGYGGVYTQAAGLAAAELALGLPAPAWFDAEVFDPNRPALKPARAGEATAPARDRRGARGARRSRTPPRP